MKHSLLLLFIVIHTLLFSQNERSILCYNVENLFDTIDDPKKDDSEFLPSGKNEWNSANYF